MLDIRTLFKKHNIEVSDEIFETFNKEFRRDYKSVEELKKYTAKLKEIDDYKLAISEKDKLIQTLTSERDKFKVDYEGLNSQLSAEAEKKLFDDSLKGVEFVSDRVKRTIIDEIKSKNLEQKDGKLVGLDNYLAELYKEDPKIFSSVDSTVHTFTGGTDTSTEEKLDTSKYDKYFKW